VGFYATKGRTPERFRNASSGIAIFENIAFQINFMHRPVQRRFNRREISFAVLQQGNLIVWNNSGHSRVDLFPSFQLAFAKSIDETVCGMLHTPSRFGLEC